MMSIIDRNRKGFTLIELLVVIAIIAILAAILFPVFAKVREKARAITCVSNEKQMGLAILEYVQDNDETFPRGQYPDYSHNWDFVISPYVQNGHINAGENVTGGVWQCPDFPVANTPDQYQVRDDLFGYPNPGGQLSTNSSGSGYYWPPAIDAQIDSPASKWMVFEGGAQDPVATPLYHLAYWVTAPWFWTDGSDDNALPGDFSDCDQPSGAGHPWQGCEYYPRYRHTTNSNVLYCDGHVKNIHKGQIDYCKDIYIPGLYSAAQSYSQYMSWYGSNCVGVNAP